MYALLVVSEKLDALLPEEWEQLHAAGHEYGEVLMAVVDRAHKAGGQLWTVPPRTPIQMPPGFAPLAKHELSLPVEADMLDVIQRKELTWHEARLPQVAEWEAKADGVLAADVIGVQKLKELVHAGAEAFDVRLEYMSRRASPSTARSGLRSDERLTQLHSQLLLATSWCEKSADLASRSQSIETLSGLVQEATAFSLRLQEVEEVAAKLEKMSSWISQARALMAEPCELRELQDMQRESEQLRIKEPESEALRLRCQACKRWVNQIHNDLLRRVSSRTAGGAKLSAADVESLLVQARDLKLDAPEIRQAEDRLAESKRWREQAAALLQPPQAVDQGTLEVLEDLSARVDDINMALPEQPMLDERLTAVKAWLARAHAMLTGRGEVKEMAKLVKEAAVLLIQLPELPKLAKQQQVAALLAMPAAWLGPV